MFVSVQRATFLLTIPEVLLNVLRIKPRLDHFQELGAHLRSPSGDPVKEAAESGSKHTNYKVTVFPPPLQTSPLQTTLINHIQLKRNSKCWSIATRRIFP